MTSRYNKNSLCERRFCFYHGSKTLALFTTRASFFNGAVLFVERANNVVGDYFLREKAGGVGL